MVEIDARCRGEWLSVAGGGALKGEMLRQAGYDSGAVSGYGLGVGIERLVQARDGIEDIRDLGKPPYVEAN